jgi:glutamyl-tRNA synthetase
MLHPQNPERGFREYTLKPDASIYFPAKDMLEIAEGETIRLKDLCVARRENGKIVYSDNKPVGRVKIIQWAPENSSKVSIFHPDGSIDSGMLEPLATRKNMVVQLERYGYVNLQGDKGYFLHK